MQKIVLIFLGTVDQATLSYQGVENEVKKKYETDKFVVSLNTEEIEDFLNQFNTNVEDLLVTVLAHGGVDCIAAQNSETEWTRLLYTTLFEYLIPCRTNGRVLINLVAPCNSINALNFLDERPIDEIWYNNRPSNSLHNGLTVASQGFDRFKFMDISNHFHKYSRP